MGNPFGQATDRPFGIQSISAGVRESALPEPPAFANLQHWFDFTDGSTLWQDVPGTIPVTNGSIVLSADNKGFESDRLTQPGPAPPNEPIYLTNVVNGLSIIDSNGGSAFIASAPIVNPSGATGMTMGLVARRTDLLAASVGFFWGFGINQIVAIGPGANPNWEGDSIGIPALLDSNKLIVIDEWVWGYLSLFAGDNNLRVAGESEVNTADGYTQQVGSFISFDLIRGVQYAEGLVWDKELTPAERDDFILYVDNKYGVMPFI